MIIIFADAMNGFQDVSLPDISLPDVYLPDICLLRYFPTHTFLYFRHFTTNMFHYKTFLYQDIFLTKHLFKDGGLS